MVAVGAVVMVTWVVNGIAGQPPLAGREYVTVYEPAVEVEGVMAPVPELIDKPVVDEYVPPVVPVRVIV